MTMSLFIFTQHTLFGCRLTVLSDDKFVLVESIIHLEGDQAESHGRVHNLPGGAQLEANTFLTSKGPNWGSLYLDNLRILHDTRNISTCKSIVRTDLFRLRCFE